MPLPVRLLKLLAYGCTNIFTAVRETVSLLLRSVVQKHFTSRSTLGIWSTTRGWSISLKRLQLVLLIILLR